MGHDDFDFLAGKVFEQRIRHDDATRVSPAHNSGICLPCLVNQRPFENSAYWNLDTPGQAVDTLLEILVFHRLELEEQRQQQYRRQIRHGHDECDEGKTGVDPPGNRVSAKQKVNDFNRRDYQRNTNRETLEFVLDPVPQRLARKPKPVLDVIARVEVQGELNDFEDHADDQNVDEHDRPLPVDHGFSELPDTDTPAGRQQKDQEKNVENESGDADEVFDRFVFLWLVHNNRGPT